MVFAILTGPLSYLMCFLFAWLINELPRIPRAIMTLVFYAPSISGNVYLVWKLIFSSDTYGYANAESYSYTLAKADRRTCSNNSGNDSDSGNYCSNFIGNNYSGYNTGDNVGYNRSNR